MSKSLVNWSKLPSTEYIHYNSKWDMIWTPISNSSNTKKKITKCSVKHWKSSEIVTRYQATILLRRYSRIAGVPLAKIAGLGLRRGFPLKTSDLLREEDKYLLQVYFAETDLLHETTDKCDKSECDKLWNIQNQDTKLLGCKIFGVCGGFDAVPYSWYRALHDNLCNNKCVYYSYPSAGFTKAKNK